MSRKNRGGPPAAHREISSVALRRKKAQIKDLMGKITELRKKLGSYRQQIDELVSANEELRLQKSKMQKDLTVQKEGNLRIENDLKHKIAYLKEQIYLRKHELDILVIGEAACLFEQAICSYVLPEVYENNKVASIRQLLNYLNDGKKLPKDLKLSEDESQRVLQEARQKWIELCRNVLEFPKDWELKTGQGWDTESEDQEILNDIPDTIKAICWLKQCRNEIAHPEPVILQEAEKKIVSMVDVYPPAWFGIIKQFISVSMRAMLEKGQLNHRKLDTTVTHNQN